MKTLLLILFLSVQLLAQQVYTSSVVATDSICTAIRLERGEFLTNVSTTDSLTGTSDSLAVASKTLKLYVFYGDTTGFYQDTTTTLLEAAGWNLITEYDTGGTDYAITIAKQKNVPLYFQQMVHYIGVGRTQTTSLLYVVPYIVLGTGTDVTLTFIGQLY